MFDISFSIFYHSVLPSIGAINYAFLFVIALFISANTSTLAFRIYLIILVFLWIPIGKYVF